MDKSPPSKWSPTSAHLPRTYSTDSTTPLVKQVSAGTVVDLETLHKETAERHVTIDDAIDDADDNASLTYQQHFKQFLRFVGPTWLIAVTFVDPGGIEGAMQQGAETQYALIWISFWSIVLGYVFQVLAARISIVTGKSLAALCVEKYPSQFKQYVIWFMIEGSVFGDDFQACVGSMIAIQIMTGIPYYAACLLIIAVTILLTAAYYFSPTKLETFVGVLLLAMLICVLVNVGYSPANGADVMYGWVVPDVPAGSALTVVGSVGGVITPSALFLGSAMVLTRPVNRQSTRQVKNAVNYSTIELLLGGCVAFIAILAVILTFAVAFYTPECAAQGVATVDGQCYDIQLSDGPASLEQLYGTAALYVFGFVLLISGLNSLISATLAGQATWEGFTGSSLSFWRRQAVTRTVVLLPTLIIALTVGNDSLTYSIINDWINIYMSLAMPFAMLPTLHFVASKSIMKDMAIPVWRVVCTLLLVVGLIAINFYLLAEFLFDPDNFGSDGDFPTSSIFYGFAGALWLFYVWLLWQVAAEPVWELYDYCMQWHKTYGVDNDSNGYVASKVQGMKSSLQLYLMYRTGQTFDA